MPRYFFNLDDHHREEDLEGTELAGPEAARIAAVVYAGECLRDNPAMLWDGSRFRVEVRDQARSLLLRVSVEAENPAAK